MTEEAVPTGDLLSQPMLRAGDDSSQRAATIWRSAGVEPISPVGAHFVARAAGPDPSSPPGLTPIGSGDVHISFR